MKEHKLFQLFNKKVFNIQPGLERIKQALTELGNPQESFPSVLVAGTNGKGSVCAYLESLFRHHGYKTGLFTSPHLIEENERWQINRQSISDDELQEYVYQLKPFIQKYNLTYFEACTLLAFKYFSDQKVDVGVVEVGLGGRWDATNVLYPDVSVITNVSFDHMDILGNTLMEIAFEKTGITRQDRPVVVGRNQPEIIYWLDRRDIKTRYIRDLDFTAYTTNYSSFEFVFGSFKIQNISLSMIGSRQVENATTALSTFITYCRQYNINFEEDKIKKALNQTRWQGRMQVLMDNPTVITDGGHNTEGLEKTFSEIKQIFPNKKIITVYSFLKDKETTSMFDIIKQNSDRKIATQISISRGMTEDDFRNLGETVFISNPLDAIKKAISMADENSIIVITGSLYLVGEVLDGWSSLNKQT